MGWLILGLIVLGYIVLIMRWSLKGVFDDDCERVKMGYNCRYDKCECNKETSYGNPNKEK